MRGDSTLIKYDPGLSLNGTHLLLLGASVAGQTCACPGHAFILHAFSLQSSPALIMHRDMVGMQKLLVQLDTIRGRGLSLLHDAPI